jgi:malonate transporter and related proteins
MAKALIDALVPIFAGLLIGFWAGRRGLIDNVNVRSLIALVMSIAAPCALFLIIIKTSRAILQQQIWTSLAITLTFAVLYIGCYFWARRNTNSVSESAVIALTFAFPNSAAIAVSLLTNYLWAWSSCTGSPLHRYGSSRYISRHIGFVGD